MDPQPSPQPQVQTPAPEPQVQGSTPKSSHAAIYITVIILVLIVLGVGFYFVNKLTSSKPIVQETVRTTTAENVKPKIQVGSGTSDADLAVNTGQLDQDLTALENDLKEVTGSLNDKAGDLAE